MKEAIEKILKDNMDGDMKSLEFRNMLTQQLLGIISAPPTKGKMGATVMTQEAAMYNPKEGGKPARPQSV